MTETSWATLYILYTFWKVSRLTNFTSSIMTVMPGSDKLSELVIREIIYKMWFTFKKIRNCYPWSTIKAVYGVSQMMSKHPYKPLYEEAIAMSANDNNVFNCQNDDQSTGIISTLISQWTIIFLLLSYIHATFVTWSRQTFFVSPPKICPLVFSLTRIITTSLTNHANLLGQTILLLPFPKKREPVIV